MSFSNFKNNAQPYTHNLNSQHHVIANNKNFVMDRKVVTIHSNDRDYSKYHSANKFNIKLGTQFDNVQSVRLIDYQFPKNLYTFSDKYCNTTFRVYYTTWQENENDTYTGPDDKKIESTDGGFDSYFSKSDQKDINSQNWSDSDNLTLWYFDVRIPEGNYTGRQLATMIHDKGNILLKKNDSETETKQLFSCSFSETEDKLYFIGLTNLIFDFNRMFNYTNVESSVQNEIIDQKTNWGLGYNMGFEKQLVFTKVPGANNNIKYMKDGVVQEITSNQHYITSESPVILQFDPVLYLDINRLNQIDEIVPYCEKTTSRYNNNSSYKNNGAFAKINMDSNGYVSNLSNIKDIFYSDTPLKSLDRLEIKVRHHDGRMVDFVNKEFTIVLEINCLRDRHDNGKIINVPSFYQL
tara:strand:+ start:103 stop:1326 length:1224 start_codon:yes stop_codon:yes gene_type:complete